MGREGKGEGELKHFFWSSERRTKQRTEIHEECTRSPTKGYLSVVVTDEVEVVVHSLVTANLSDVPDISKCSSRIKLPLSSSCLIMVSSNEG